MKALRFYSQRDIRIEDVPIPEIGEDDVLIKVLRAGISQTQVNEFVEGPFFIDRVLIPSQEYGGIVVDVGKNVDKSLIGKKVAVLPLVGCGECEYCKNSMENLCENVKYHGLKGLDGGFCEYSRVHKNNIFEVQKDELLTFIEPILVAIHSASRYAPFGTLKNKNVLILGAGAIGVSIAAVYRDYFGANVYINDMLPQRLKRACKAGFSAIAKDEIKEYDLVIDAAGMDTVIENPAIIEGLGYLKKNSPLINIGTYFHNVEFLPSLPLLKELMIVSSFAYRYDDINTLKKVLKTLKCDFSIFIDEIDFDEIIENGYYRLEAQKDSATRIVVRINND
ncbi:MAG: alcohol dehydrogenase catalytic domain-containing protein [Epsilonproteobacteria bacterium]|nr:alcohol dehydrogenase catalytic domain-containing protein [Campylobacterota bacterium]